MKYLLDFDRTLFDTATCYKALADKWGDPLEFTPKLWTDFNACNYLYQDVISWLDAKNKSDLYIVTAFTPSYGAQSAAYQKEKINCSQLIKEVEEVVVMEGLKGKTVAEIAKQFPPDETIVFVDDRIEQCLSVQALNPNVICCLMVRDKLVIGEVIEVQGMPVVHCLADVDDVINRL